MSEIKKFEQSGLSLDDKILELDKGTRKMRTYKESDWEKFTMEIAGMSAIMGLKKVTDQEIKFIIDFLKAKGNDMSYSELTNAFQMNLAGEFGDIVKPYGSIINHVGEIMAKYRSYRMKVKARQKPKPIVKSEDQKKQEFNKMIEEAFESLCKRFKTKSYGFTYSEGIMYYDALKHLKIMPEYKDKKLWELSMRQAVETLAGSTDKESKQILSSFKDAGQELDQRLHNRKKAMITNIYKGHLLLKFLEESEFFDSLEEARETLKK